MNNKDIIDALVAARSFKSEQKRNEQIFDVRRNPTSFVSMYDELDKMDSNTFDNPFAQTFENVNERVKMQSINPNTGKNPDGTWKGQLKTSHKVGSEVWTAGPSNEEDYSPELNATTRFGKIIGIGGNHIKVKHNDGTVKQYPPSSLHASYEDAVKPPAKPPAKRSATVKSKIVK